MSSIVKAIEAVLAEAKEGKVTGIAIITTKVDGDISFTVDGGGQAIPTNLIGTMEWAKTHILHKATLQVEEASKKASPQTPVQ